MRQALPETLLMRAANSSGVLAAIRKPVLRQNFLTSGICTVYQCRRLSVADPHRVEVAGGAEHTLPRRHLATGKGKPSPRMVGGTSGIALRA